MRRPHLHRIRRTSLVVGAAAVIAMGGVCLARGDEDPSSAIDLAKDSGASATGTEYVQPSVTAATMGATVTADTTPSSVPATTKAVPPLKGS